MSLNKKVIIFIFLIFAVLAICINALLWLGQGALHINLLLLFFAIITLYYLELDIIEPIKTFAKKMEELVNSRIHISKIRHINDEIKLLDSIFSKIKEGGNIDSVLETNIDRAKNDFVALASHQLLTPLTIIKWHSEYVLEDIDRLSSDQIKYLHEIYQNTERLIELVNALLDVSRIDLGTFSIEPEPTKIANIAEAALETFLAEISRKQIHVIKDYDKNLPLLNLDSRLTKVVFQNIIFNSVKYTENEGYIKIGIKKNKNDIEIEISDTGCGIPKEVQPKIFSKLFRADNVRKIASGGTGLGLYIVKAIVEKSGGRIWFESPLVNSDLVQKINPGTKNFGTSIMISIPLQGMKRKRGTKKLTGYKE